MRSEVFFAAWMAAMRETAMASPLAVDWEVRVRYVWG